MRIISLFGSQADSSGSRQGLGAGGPGLQAALREPNAAAVWVTTQGRRGFLFAPRRSRLQGNKLSYVNPRACLAVSCLSPATPSSKKRHPSRSILGAMPGLFRSLAEKDLMPPLPPPSLGRHPLLMAPPMCPHNPERPSLRLQPRKEFSWTHVLGGKRGTCQPWGFHGQAMDEPLFCLRVSSKLLSCSAQLST